MIERESPKLRRNHPPKTPKKQKSRKEFKSGLAGGGQVEEHDNTKIVKKDQSQWAPDVEKDTPYPLNHVLKVNIIENIKNQ